MQLEVEQPMHVSSWSACWQYTERCLLVNIDDVLIAVAPLYVSTCTSLIFVGCGLLERKVDRLTERTAELLKTTEA